MRSLGLTWSNDKVRNVLKAISGEEGAGLSRSKLSVLTVSVSVSKLTVLTVCRFSVYRFDRFAILPF